MAYSTLNALWGLLGTEEGQNILLEEGRRNPQLLVQNLGKLTKVNHEAHAYVDAFTARLEVQNIFYTAFNDEYERIKDLFKTAKGPDGKIPLEAHETILKDLLKLKAGLVRFANMYEGRFQVLLGSLNTDIQKTDFNVQRKRAELNLSPMDKLMKKLLQLSRQIDLETEHQKSLEKGIRKHIEDPHENVPEEMRSRIIQRNLKQIERSQTYIDEFQRQMASIQSEMNTLESEGGGTVEEGEIDELEGGGGGTIEDDGDILNEVDGKYQNLSMGVYYQ